MLKANDFQDIPNGRVQVTFTWDDSEDKAQTETRRFPDKETAYRYYASMCRTYILQSRDKICQATEHLTVKIPPWMHELVFMDASEMAFKVLEQMQHIDFRAANNELRKYLKNVVENTRAAAEELKAICNKYTDIRKP